MDTIEVTQSLDKHMVDMLENKPECAISWYIIAMFAKNETDEEIISNSSLERLSRRIVDNWDVIDYKYKDHLTIDMVRNLEYNGEYPKGTPQTLKTLKAM